MMTDRTRRGSQTGAAASPVLVLTALYASVFTFSLSFGGMLPWMSLALEARGTDATVIGIVSAASAIGVLASAPLVPRLVSGRSAADAMILCAVIMVITIAAMPVFDSPISWFVLRFIAGAAGAVPWVVTETWVNVAAKDRSRARAVAGYSTALAAGYASGPLILIVVDADMISPAYVFAAIEAVAILPILLIRRASPNLSMSTSVGVLAMVAAMPMLLAAAFLAGAGDTVFFTFLPIWALRNGIDEATGIALLTVFISGNVLLQLPLGWLADKIGHRRVMAGCGLVCLAGPVLAYGSAGSVPLLGLALFVWGGAIWALYSVALAAMGARYTGSLLATANAAFVMVYTLSNIVGPPVAGLAMKTWDPHGLMILMFAMAVAFMAVLAIRRSDRDRQPASSVDNRNSASADGPSADQ